MPTYEYLCTACENQWEEVQKISEPALEVCPKCAQSTAKRQISAGNFILKGGGWYADLYSSTPKSAAKSEGASSSSSTSTTPSTSGSTAPAASSGSTAPAAAAPSASTPPSTSSK